MRIPKKGAIIYIEELKTGITTDSLGFLQNFFTSRQVSNCFSEYWIKGSQDVKSNYMHTGQLNVTLGALILNLEEVVVSANRKESIRGVQMGVERD